MKNLDLSTAVVAASVILALGLVYHAHVTKKSSEVGRFQFHPSNPPGVVYIIDTTTGDVKAENK